MNVKTCPKCGAENKLDKASCYSCYATLDGVLPSASKKADDPVSPRSQPGPASLNTPPPTHTVSEPRPRMLADGPMSEEPPARTLNDGPAPAQSAAPANPYGPPPGAQRPRPNIATPGREKSQPVKQGPNWGAIVFAIVIIAGAAFAGWWFFMKPAPPDQVVRSFFAAAKAGDYEKFKSYMTESSVTALKASGGSEEQIAEQLKQSVARSGGAELDKIVYSTPTYEGQDKAIVGIEPKDKPQLPPGAPAGLANMKFEFVLLREGGKWKIDFPQTQARLMAQMQKLIGSMPGSFGRR